MAVDKKISQLASGAPAQAGDEYVVARSGANYKLTLTNIAASMPATTITSGNLTFSSTAQRITGDFSNATVANRLMFQTSTANTATIVGVLPSGTGTEGRVTILNNSDPTASSGLDLRSLTTEAQIRANNYGGGALPMTFHTGGSERVRIDTSGNVGIGGTAGAATRLEITNTLSSSSPNTLPVVVSGTIPSSVTSQAQIFRSAPFTQAASFTCANVSHFISVGATIGAGSAVSNQYGFNATSTLTTATNNYGFYSDIASGSNRWNFYAAGTASNYFAGDVFIRTTTAVGTPNVSIYVAGGGETWQLGPEQNGNFIVYNDNDTGVYITNGQTSWTANSDERIKTALKPIENAASKVSTLRAVTGRYTSDAESVSRAFLIAQDVQAVLPEAVDVPAKKSDPLGLRYTDVVPLLVAAIKELTARVAELEAK
mgnify:CR=1 FL=1